MTKECHCAVPLIVHYTITLNFNLLLTYILLPFNVFFFLIYIYSFKINEF